MIGIGIVVGIGWDGIGIGGGVRGMGWSLEKALLHVQYNTRRTNVEENWKIEALTLQWQ